MSLNQKGAKSSKAGVLYEGRPACGLAVLEPIYGHARIKFTGEAGLGQVFRELDLSGGESAHFDVNGFDRVEFEVVDLFVGEDEPDPIVSLTFKEGARGCASYRLNQELEELETYTVPRGASGVIFGAEVTAVWNDYLADSISLNAIYEPLKLHRIPGGLLTVNVTGAASSVWAIWILTPV